MKKKYADEIVLEDADYNIINLSPDGTLLENVQGRAKYEADGIWMENTHFIPTLVSIGGQQYYILAMKKE